MLAVMGALFTNGLITILKFIAAVLTGFSGSFWRLSLLRSRENNNQAFVRRSGERI